MTDVTVADKDKFCGGRGKGLVPFRTFDAAFRARCVNRDLSHVLDDTDPNYRPQRTADVMMDDPEGVIDPATGIVRKIVKLRANACTSSWVLWWCWSVVSSSGQARSAYYALISCNLFYYLWSHTYLLFV